MSFQLNRRSFLQTLIALGASYALPENANAEQVDQVWEAAKADPWHFAVNEWGTITDPDVQEGETWGDIFWINTNFLQSSRDLINEIHACPLLLSHFQMLADDALTDLYDELDVQLNRLRRRKLKKIIHAIESDGDYGWQDWITLEGAPGVDRFKLEIENWLKQKADHSQSEWFPSDYGSQGKAKAFFERLDNPTLDALQVVIVEGEHPGSTYYAAELCQSIDEANAEAEALDLPFRFKEVAA